MIDNTDDIIDSRSVIDRIAELELEAVDRYADGREDLSYGELAEIDHLDHLDLDDAEELAALLDLAEQGEADVAEWADGATLIRDSYFEEYARQLAEDLGVIDPDASWPLSHIDWETAADDLKQDYTTVDFDGVTYWARS